MMYNIVNIIVLSQEQEDLDLGNLSLDDVASDTEQEGNATPCLCPF